MENEISIFQKINCFRWMGHFAINPGRRNRSADFNSYCKDMKSQQKIESFFERKVWNLICQDWWELWEHKKIPKVNSKMWFLFINVRNPSVGNWQSRYFFFIYNFTTQPPFLQKTIHSSKKQQISFFFLFFSFFFNSPTLIQFKKKKTNHKRGWFRTKEQGRCGNDVNFFLRLKTNIWGQFFKINWKRLFQKEKMKKKRKKK